MAVLGIIHAQCEKTIETYDYSAGDKWSVLTLYYGRLPVQWPRGLRRRSAAARLLRLRVRIPPETWTFVCRKCCVLSGICLCDELITRPEEPYRLWCVVVYDLETSWMRKPWPTGVLSHVPRTMHSPYIARFVLVISSACFNSKTAGRISNKFILKVSAKLFTFISFVIQTTWRNCPALWNYCTNGLTQVEAASATSKQLTAL